MRSIEEIKKNQMLLIQTIGEDGGYGYIYFPGGEGRPAIVIFSWGGGWDHISVSYKTRCCTWEEMCVLKDIFFREDECVVQYHPPKKDYINNHPYVLHLWKKQGTEFETPPIWMV